MLRMQPPSNARTPIGATQNEISNTREQRFRDERLDMPIELDSGNS